MPVDFVVLKAECLTNPNLYALNGQTLTQWYVAGNDQTCADILNTPRAGITISRVDVTPLEVLEAIKVTDFVPLGQQTYLHSGWFESMTQFSALRLLKADGTDTRVLTNLLTILVNASASETRLRALGSRTGSRAEQLFGVGTVLSSGDIYTTR